MHFCRTYFGLSYSPSSRGYVYKVAMMIVSLNVDCLLGQDGADIPFYPGSLTVILEVPFATYIHTPYLLMMGC
jgi:hypothetical protein